MADCLGLETETSSKSGGQAPSAAHKILLCSVPL